MISLSLHTAASPAAVLAALRTHAGDWRESHIPDDLRRAGIFSVQCRIRDASCTLSYSRIGTLDPLSRAGLQLRAIVVPDAAGGSAVQLTVRYRGHPHATIVVACFWGAGAVLLRPPAAVWAWVFGVGVWGLYHLLLRDANRGLTRGEPEADYLIQRVESAVAAAGQASIGARAP